MFEWLCHHLQVRGEVASLYLKELLLGALRERGGGERERERGKVGLQRGTIPGAHPQEGCVWDSSFCADRKKGEP